MSAKKTYDREKVTELRMELIEAGLAIMHDKPEVERWSQYKRDFILKVGCRALPILNAGKDDDTDLFPSPILDGKTKNGISKDNRNHEVAGNEEEDS